MPLRAFIQKSFLHSFIHFSPLAVNGAHSETFCAPDLVLILTEKKRKKDKNNIVRLTIMMTSANVHCRLTLNPELMYEISEPFVYAQV